MSATLPPIPDTPCVLWDGPVNEYGYGYFMSYDAVGRRIHVAAHRDAWEKEHGPIPDGLTIDHHCRVEGCIRTDHMELVTREENTRRAREWYCIEHPLCPQGHNDWAWYPSNAGRTCRTCKNEAARQYHQRRKLAKAAA